MECENKAREDGNTKGCSGGGGGEPPVDLSNAKAMKISLGLT